MGPYQTAIADLFRAIQTPARVNHAGTAVVSTEHYYSDNMADCPRGVPCVLLGQGGVAKISVYNGDPFWVEWAGLPQRAAKRPR